MNEQISNALSIAKSLSNNDALVERIKSGDIPAAPHKITNKFLADAFDRAIAHHTSLSPEDRIANSLRAENELAKFIGRGKNGKVKSLLGKNAKLMKSEEGYKGKKPITVTDGTTEKGVETTGLPLSPAYQEGNFNLCPHHQSCKAICLGLTSGNYHKLGGGMDLKAVKGPRLNSLIKTLAFLHNPEDFAVKLYDELNASKQQAQANGNIQGARMNVLSDIPPRVYKSLRKAHSDIHFYDYTKLTKGKDPDDHNLHLTYSSSGISQPEAPFDYEAHEGDQEKGVPSRDAKSGKGIVNPNQNWSGRNGMRERLLNGDNVAVAFSHKRFLPKTVLDKETGHVFDVVDGDTHDFRPMDDQNPPGTQTKKHGVIIGLRNKRVSGKMNNAAHESGGFFWHFDPDLEKPESYQRGPVPIDPKTGLERVTKSGKVALGPILNPATPKNTQVVVHPQGQSGVKNLNEETGVGGMPQAFRRGGFVRDARNGLEEDEYLNQFPGLHHHDHDEGDGNHRRWWEPLRSGKSENNAGSDKISRILSQVNQTPGMVVRLIKRERP